MASMAKKTANALSQESDLLNVHADLKAVANKFDTLMSTQEAASKRVLNWGERKEAETDPSIQELLNRMYEFEQDATAVDRKYNEHFRIFVKLWKGILSEKKELNMKLKHLDSVRGKVKDTAKKAQKAEAKEPAHKVEQRIADLREAQAAESEAEESVTTKLLEVQQDKHESLRAGYTGLLQASLSRMKEHVAILERMRQQLNAFPEVVGREKEGTFLLAAYSGPPIEIAHWYQGEVLFKELQEIQQAHEAEKRRIHNENSAKLSELVRQQEVMAEQFQEMHSGKLSNLNADQRAMIDNLNAAHVAKVADLERQRTDLEADHAATLEEEARKFTQLETVLRSKVAEIEQHLKAKADLVKQLAEAQSEVIARAIRHGSSELAQASLGMKRPCMETFMDAAAQAKAAADGMLTLLTTDQGRNCELVDTKTSEFVSQSVEAMLSAAGAAAVSRAENAMELLQVLDPAPDIASDVLNLAKGLVDSGVEEDADNGGSDATAETGPQMVEALYAHAGKVQDGFTLIGFDKGQILTLVRRREDGWSRVQLGSNQGWAPSTYLKDVPRETPQARQKSSSAKPGSEISASEAKRLVALYRDTLTAATEKAKQIALRDRELAKLSNQLANAIEDKVSAAQQSIMDATKLLEKLLAQTKATDTGRLLEVNEQLLQAGLKMQHGMTDVINSAEGMRAALQRSRGGQTEDQFNAKHNSWFEALNTSVDAVVDGNPLLTEAVRSVLGRRGKHEELQVASRTITAAVAQLASLSRTKSLAETHESGAGEQVPRCCAAVIETGTELLSAARESQDLALASVLMEDFTELTENQAKRLTMATQVNVLKLEKDLEREREKLGRLRRLTYQE